MNNWSDSARCREEDPDIFFDKSRNGVYLHKTEALKFCAECSVSTRCLDFAMEIPSNQGIWAGTRESGRAALASLRRLQADEFWMLLEGPLGVVASDVEQKTVQRLQTVLR